MAAAILSTTKSPGKKVKIYALIDPISGRPRYVGQTRVKYLCNRLAGHWHIRDRSPKALWLLSLKAAGRRPTIELLEVVSQEDAVRAESFWIDEMRRKGESLLNEYSPDLSAPRPIASREKISEFRKGHTGWSHSEETKAKIGRRGALNSQAKLTDSDVRNIRAMVAAGSTQRSAARKHGVSAQTVCDIISGKKWAHVE